jgi:hypothetical protein
LGDGCLQPTYELELQLEERMDTYLEEQPIRTMAELKAWRGRDTAAEDGDSWTILGLNHDGVMRIQGHNGIDTRIPTDILFKDNRNADDKCVFTCNLTGSYVRIHPELHRHLLKLLETKKAAEG